MRDNLLEVISEVSKEKALDRDIMIRLVVESIVQAAKRKLPYESIEGSFNKRTGQIDGMPNDPVTLVKEGRIHYRNIPVQQTLEDWNDFWSEYKNA